MAIRLICQSTLRQVKVVQQQLCVSYGIRHRLRVPYVECNRNWSRTSTLRLHVKVYDHEAKLDALRQAQTLESAETVDLDEIDREEVPKDNANKHIRNASVEPEALKEAVSKKDVFGSSRITEGDEGDQIEEEYIRKPTRSIRKLRTKEYAIMIKDHLNAHRLKEALSVLEVRMLKEDRVKPENYIYNLLISGCAKAGQTRKAFSLFTRMRQRDLKVTGGTYTSLFNACANSHSAADGLTRANRLREIMLEKGYEPNTKNYNAMIKAYGRCGDPKTAYMLADEMLEKQLPIDTDTMNFLLQACASDSEQGFRHGLLTWHKMLQRGLRPDYYTFTTLLRCIRDCGFGDLPTMQKVLHQILGERQSMPLLNVADGSSQLQISTLAAEHESLTNYNQLPTAINTASPDLQQSSELQQFEIPNLLLPQPHLGSLVALSDIQNAHERFLLVGGLNGFLAIMKEYNVTPDIQAFTTMLEVIPPTNAAEKQLLAFIRKIGLKADIDFFNILIKKRSLRFDYEGAREVLSMVRTAKLQPDIVTYGVLALGCRTVDEARQLLIEMRDKGVRMNIQILGAMLRQGCASKNFAYIMEIMQICLDERIKPNDVFLRHLHNFYVRCARAIDARHPSTKVATFKKGHAKFCDKLRLFNEELGIANLQLDEAIRKLRENPFGQLKGESETGIEEIKNLKLARKQKQRKYIKKIKLANLRDDSPNEDPVRRIE